VAYIPRVFGFAQFLSWIPVWVPMAGYLLLLGLHMRSQGNRYDRRYPWSRVTSVAAAVEKFHVKVDDEEVPQGFLIDVGAKDRKSVAELLAARALFHDEAAAAMRTT
jgi:hypothetical protein